MTQAGEDRHVSSFNGVCKKVDRSAKYCGVVQNIVEHHKKITGAQNIVELRNMSSRSTKYHQEVQNIMGAVQNIGAVPRNQKQDSIN